jgi:hypothetical protein
MRSVSRRADVETVSFAPKGAECSSPSSAACWTLLDLSHGELATSTSWRRRAHTASSPRTSTVRAQAQLQLFHFTNGDSFSHLSLFNGAESEQTVVL